MVKQMAGLAFLGCPSCEPLLCKGVPNSKPRISWQAFRNHSPPQESLDPWEPEYTSLTTCPKTEDRHRPSLWMAHLHLGETSRKERRKHGVDRRPSGPSGPSCHPRTNGFSGRTVDILSQCTHAAVTRREAHAFLV